MYPNRKVRNSEMKGETEIEEADELDVVVVTWKDMCHKFVPCRSMLG